MTHDGISVVPDRASLRSVLAALKEFDPAYARGFRRTLRGTGARIIAKQKAILAGPVPSKIRHTGTRSEVRYSEKLRRMIVVKHATFEDRTGGRTRHTGMRDAIADGLRTRVVAGKTRQGVQVQTTRARAPMSIAYQSKVFRHPLFGDEEKFYYQKGKPYFWQPAVEGIDDMRRDVNTALDEALKTMEGTQ